MRSWDELRRQSPALRKSVSLSKQIPRLLRRVTGSRGGSFSVVANSFPKSGTHLLVQILEAFPGVTNYDSFIAQKAPIRFRERSDRTIVRRIGWIAPGELVSAHMHHKPKYVDRLRERSAVVYFIYRDLRDAVRSEAYYLTHMNRWHRAHAYFADELETDDDRLTAAITGIPEDRVDFRYPDIASRFEPYAGWLREEVAFPVKFEDLNSRRREVTIRAMVQFFRDRTGVDCDVDAVVRSAVRAIDPEKSRTYRKNKQGDWRSVFTDEHREQMKRVAGDLLLDLGYERSRDW